MFGTVITPRTAARASANGPANSAQTAAARDAVRQAFGSYYAIRNVQFTASPEDASGTVFVALSTGYLQLSWPDRTQVTASIDDSDTGPESGFPVTGVLGPMHDQQQAIATATLYARRRYPWGPHNARAEAEPVGPGGSLGWLVSWRRYRDGVLMPMRLDVQVDRAGRVSQLSARAIADPNVPHPTVTRPTAAKAAAHAAPGCGRPQVGELLAVQTKGTWRPVWRVVMTCTASSTVANVDAVTAKVESEQHYGAAPPTADAGPAN